MNIEMNKNEKYLLAMISVLYQRLVDKGVLKSGDYEKIVKDAQELWYYKLTQEHEGFGI